MSSAMWDLSDRATWQDLEQRASSDARMLARQLWPNSMPHDFRELAERETWKFIRWYREQSAAVPRWAFQNQDLMRRHYQQLGNGYYWTFLRTFTHVIADRVLAQGRLPRQT